MLESLISYERGLTDWYAYTPLKIAAKMGHTEAVKILAPHEHGIWSGERTAMLIAAENGHREAVDILTQYEAGIKDSDGAEYTSLMKAARNNEVEAVKLLIPYEKAL